MISIINGNFQQFVFFMTIMMSLYINLEARPSIFNEQELISMHCRNKLPQQYDQGADDNKMIAEIISLGINLYTDVIDISALYFSGIVVDTNQIYEHLMLKVGKDLFHVVKLLAAYWPKMLQNPHIKWTEKLKKTVYISTVLVAFWLWAKEGSNNASRKKTTDSDLSSHSLGSLPIYDRHMNDMYSRPRPSGWKL
jgi:hypothetical protein